MAAPNQRKITIHTEKCNANNPYTTINLKALEQAMQELIPIYPAAFELWVYFSKNRDGYYLEVSSEEIRKNYGISRDRYQKAWKVLVDKGYIVEQSPTTAEFHQIPSRQENPVVTKQENPVISSPVEQDFPVITKQDNPVRNIHKGNITVIHYKNNNTVDSPAPWEPQRIDPTLLDSIPSSRKKKINHTTWEILTTDGEWHNYQI